MSELYENLMMLMKEKGVSRTELSEKTGIANSRFSELKSGIKKGLKSDEIIKIAQALNISADELLGISDEPTATEQLLDELDENEKTLLRLSKKASEEELQMFIKMLKGMVGDED